MVKAVRRRYVLFEASAGRRLSRGELIHALNVMAGKLGIDGEDRPWLMVLEEVVPSEMYLGIFRVPHTVKEAIMGAMESGLEVKGIALRAIATSGTIRTVKECLVKRRRSL